MLKKIELQKVDYIPKELSFGILYVAEEFGAAAHLCACGCGAKIRTPLGPTEWMMEETNDGPTLRPSVGNWQQKCQSHYFIRRGMILWAGRWSDEQISAGRKAEEMRRELYYKSLQPERSSGFWRFRAWVKRWLS